MVKLSESTQRLVQLLFPASEQETTCKMLVKDCGNNLPYLADADEYKLERFRFAAIKISHGDLNELFRAVKVAQYDWRDLLMEAGFGVDVTAHEKWIQSVLGEQDNFTNWQLVGIVPEGVELKIDEVNVWSQQWKLVENQFAEVIDPRDFKKCVFNVYTITSGNVDIKFAAGEFPRRGYGFYVDYNIEHTENQQEKPWYSLFRGLPWISGWF
jgi:hypothetical protein